MKIVMTYDVTDGCTYSCEVTLPLEYDSPEQAKLDFEAAFNAANVIDPVTGYFHGTFMMFGQEFFVVTFKYEGEVTLPNFYSLDEWFNIHRIC